MSREAELEAQSRSELRMAERSEEEAAGCAVWGTHQNLLGQGEMGPFGTGMKSVLRSASGVCSTLNPRWCREQWELPCFNVMVGVATFPGSQNSFPYSILSTCGHALTLTQCNICCCGLQWASPIIWHFIEEHWGSLFSAFPLLMNQKATSVCDLQVFPRKTIFSFLISIFGIWLIFLKGTLLLIGSWFCLLIYWVTESFQNETAHHEKLGDNTVSTLSQESFPY